MQARVIERHLEGASNREIGAEEGIDRATVTRILSQRELVEMRAEQQSWLQRLVSKALVVYDKSLDSADPHLAAATATKILEGTGVMDKRGLQGTIDDSIHREAVHNTNMLLEFGRGPFEFKRQRKPRRVPAKTELQIVRDPLIEEGSRVEGVLEEAPGRDHLGSLDEVQ